MRAGDEGGQRAEPLDAGHADGGHRAIEAQQGRQAGLGGAEQHPGFLQPGRCAVGDDVGAAGRLAGGILGQQRGRHGQRRQPGGIGQGWRCGGGRHGQQQRIEGGIVTQGSQQIGCDAMWRGERHGLGQCQADMGAAGARLGQWRL